MSNWTHPLCYLCWGAEHPDQVPVMLKDPETETCCRCGYATRMGIYVRENPDKMLCCTRDHDLLVGLEKPATGHGRERASQQQWPG